MITTKERAYLKSLANTLKPSLLLGKGEIDETFIKAVTNALDAHELIKIRILNNASMEIKEIGTILSKSLNAEVVSIIGRVITLYRVNKQKRIIILP